MSPDGENNATTGTQQIMAIYHDEIRGLYAMIARRTGHDRALAEDITQETWLRAIRDWAKRGLPRSPGAWLRTVALNLLRDHARKRTPELIPAESLNQWLGDDPCPVTEDIVDTVIWGITQLNRTQAELIGAFHIDGRSVRQIATEMKLTEKAVERRLERARTRLRAVLSRTTVAASAPTHDHTNDAHSDVQSSAV